MSIKKNLKDKKVIYTLFLAVLLIGLHIYQFIKSGYMTEPLINLIMVSVYIPIVLFFGFSCLPYYLLVYSFILIPFEAFNNYTSLFLLCSAISLNRKVRLCFIPYCVETLVCYISKGWQISHISITALYIVFFWNIYVYIQDNHYSFEPLILKPEEEKILSELAEGKQQKEITFYSAVTVSKKLKEARERNDCISNNELVTRYKLTNQLN